MRPLRTLDDSGKYYAAVLDDQPQMVFSRAYYPENRGQVFDTLRREILAARLKVTLDRELKRETSEMVMRLAGMKLPPIVQMTNYLCDVQTCAVVQKALDIRVGHRRTMLADEMRCELRLDG